MDRSISVLESISEFLKDKKGLNYHQIGLILNRDERTIWTCYSRAKKKRREAPRKSDSLVRIPTEILRDRSLSVLESIVEFLKEEKRMRYSEIAALLGRDDRTVWTCHNRAKKKRGAE